ncbi:MAG: aldo/keto reductase [Armatimonadota bacterium]
MQYRQFGRTHKMLSALGFGAMRLPKDRDYAIQCIRRSLDLGVNFVDTAPGYGDSELIVGEAIKDRRRDVYLSTKNPIGDDMSATGWRQRLEKSLERLQTDYIDFYQVVHSLSWKQYTGGFAEPGAGLDEARKAKEQGIIHHMCFSCHDTPENIVRLIDTGDFEGMIVQYNLLDRKNEHAIAHAADCGMGVIVMGPVGGGRLAAPSQEIRGLIPGGTKSSAEAALRFVLSNPNVTCAISGMNTIEMVDENCATASREEPLTELERQYLLDMLEEKQKFADLYCTGCGYCMPCPNDVNIPQNFTIMNYHRVYGLTQYAKQQYKRFGAERWPLDGKNAGACEECGECEPKCPQNIKIIEQLREVHRTLSD